MERNVLVVCGNDDTRGLIAGALEDDYHVMTETTGAGAIARVIPDEAAVVITDDVLADMSGEELATAIHDVRSDARVVIVATHDAIESALSVVGPGEFVYMEKPPTAARVRHVVALEYDRVRIDAENRVLRARIDGSDPRGALLGSSLAIDHARARVRYLAESSANVLVTGAAGTGKRLAAEGIHRASARRSHPLVRIDCATSDDDTLARDIFGFTHADAHGNERHVPGRLERAQGGTLLVQDIGEMSPAIQERFVAALSGATDVRVVATSQHDLQGPLRSGRFREDLYYAINVLDITMPTLDERRADIPALVSHFARFAASRNGVAPVRFTPAAVERLTNASWPGNVRELHNVIERAVLLAGGLDVDADDLRMGPRGRSAPGTDQAEVDRTFRTGSVRDMERLMILNRLAGNGGNRTRSAETLEISVRTLRNKLNEYGVGRGSSVPEEEAFSI